MSNDCFYSNQYVCFSCVYDLNRITIDNANNPKFIEELNRVADVLQNKENKIVNNLSSYGIITTISMFSYYFILSYYSIEADNCFSSEVFNRIRYHLCELQYQLAVEDIWINGGMAYGPYFNYGDICIGPALINAVNVSKGKRRPLIYLHTSIDVGKREGYIDWMKQCLNEDEYRIRNLNKVIKNSIYKKFNGYSAKYMELETYYKESINSRRSYD